MPDWDENSERLQKNCEAVLEQIERAAIARDVPTITNIKAWHTRLMSGLNVPDPKLVGAFRGEPGLVNVQVRVGANYGVASTKVAVELKRFETKLQKLVKELDALLPSGHEPDADQLAAIIDLCAWAHAEWARIHPFANGNGRTARLLANGLAMRYGIPPFVSLRPRPDNGYANAGARAMQRDWKPTAIVFRRLLDDFLNNF